MITQAELDVVVELELFEELLVVEEVELGDEVVVGGDFEDAVGEGDEVLLEPTGLSDVVLVVVVR
jgi:hypothetical protein